MRDSNGSGKRGSGPQLISVLLKYLTENSQFCALNNGRLMIISIMKRMHKSLQGQKL